jgi:hypothetical protein
LALAKAGSSIAAKMAIMARTATVKTATSVGSFRVWISFTMDVQGLTVFTDQMDIIG